MFKFKIFILVVVQTGLLFAQENDEVIASKENEFWENVYYGGGLQLSFGNGYTVLGITPSAVYEFNEKWAIGVGISYLYVKDKVYNQNLSALGGSSLVFYKPINQLELNTEIEYLHIDKKRIDETNKYWVPAWYVGIGYAVGRWGSLGVKYDLLWDENKSIYNDAFTPYFRFYF